MGTSTSCPLPTTREWQTVKSRATQLARRGCLTTAVVRQWITSYIKAAGGPDAIVAGTGVPSTRQSIQRIIIRLADCLSDVAADGLPALARHAEYPDGVLQEDTAASVAAVVTTLFDTIGKPPDTLEDVAARAALLRLRTMWAADVGSLAELVTIFTHHAKRDAMGKVLVQLCGYYLAEQLTAYFFEYLNKRTVAWAANDFFWSIRLYIDSTLSASEPVRTVQALDWQTVVWHEEQGQQYADLVLKTVLTALAPDLAASRPDPAREQTPPAPRTNASNQREGNADIASDAPREGSHE